MHTEPSCFPDYEDYLGYEIRIEVFGPIKTDPLNPNDNSTHYVARLGVFYKGEEVPGTEEALKVKFPTKDEATKKAFERGRIIVGQVR